MKHRSGFTFIEMLVAMSIAVGMMLFVNQIVGHSAEAVRLGESASQVIESARIITDQMTKDIERMLLAFAQAGLQKVDLRWYEGGRHEMFNETNSDEVVADLIGWLDRTVAKLTTGEA